MLTEMLVLANDHVLLPGTHGPCKMTDALYDMVLPCVLALSRG